MQKYKIEMIRIPKPRFEAAKEIEKIINDFYDEGWSVRSLNFLPDIYTYEIFLVKSEE